MLAPEEDRSFEFFRLSLPFPLDGRFFCTPSMKSPLTVRGWCSSGIFAPADRSGPFGDACSGLFARTWRAATVSLSAQIPVSILAEVDIHLQGLAAPEAQRSTTPPDVGLKHTVFMASFNTPHDTNARRHKTLR